MADSLTIKVDVDTQRLLRSLDKAERAVASTSGKLVQSAQASIDRIQQLFQGVERYKELDAQLKAAQSSLISVADKLNVLNSQASRSTAVSAALVKNISDVKKAYNEAVSSVEKITFSMESLSAALIKAGVNTSDLSRAEQTLSTTLKVATDDLVLQQARLALGLKITQQEALSQSLQLKDYYDILKNAATLTTADLSRVANSYTQLQSKLSSYSQLAPALLNEWNLVGAKSAEQINNQIKELTETFTRVTKYYGANTDAIKRYSAALSIELKKLNKDLSELTPETQAGKALGVKSVLQLKNEIKELQDAYSLVQKSGVYSAESVATAYNNLNKAVSVLNRQLTGVSDFFTLANTRSTAEIRREIKALNEAYEVFSKNAKASEGDRRNAAVDYNLQLKALNAELNRGNVEHNAAARAAQAYARFNAKSYEELKSALAQAKKDLEELTKQAGGSNTERARYATRLYAETVRTLEEKLYGATKAVKELNTLGTPSVEKVNASIKQVLRELTTYAATASNTPEAIRRATQDAANTVKKLEDSIRSTTQSTDVWRVIGIKSPQQIKTETDALLAAQKKVNEQYDKGSLEALAANKRISSSLKTLEDYYKNITRSTTAWEKLGGRSLDDIKTKTRELILAYKELKATGTHTQKELDYAWRLLNKAVAENKKSISDIRKETTDWEILGVRSTANVEAQVQRLQAAYNRLARTGFQGGSEAQAVEALARGIRSLRNEVDAAQSSYQRLQLRPPQAVLSDIRAVKEAYKELTATLSPLDREQMRLVRAMRGQLKDLKNELKSTVNQTNILGTVLRQVFGYALIQQATSHMMSFVKSTVQAGIAIQNAQTALLGILGETGKPATALSASTAELKYITDFANKAGLNLEKLIPLYVRWTASVKDTSLQGSESRLVFEQFSKTFELLGFSTSQVEHSFLALTQMLGKGRVQREELQRQLGQHIPNAMGIAAKSVNATQQEFSKMLESGGVLTTDFIPRFADELVKAFSGTGMSTTQRARSEFARLTNAIYELKITIGSGDFLRELVEAAASLTKSLQENGGLNDAAKALSEALAFTVGFSRAFVENSGEAVRATLSLAGGFAAASLVIAAYNGTLLTMLGVLPRLITAVRVFVATLALTTVALNPAVLIPALAAISAFAATGWLVWKQYGDKVEDVTEKEKKHTEEFKKKAKSLKEVSDAFEKPTVAAEKALRKVITTATEQLSRYDSALKEQQQNLKKHVDNVTDSWKSVVNAEKDAYAVRLNLIDQNVSNQKSALEKVDAQGKLSDKKRLERTARLFAEETQQKIKAFQEGQSTLFALIEKEFQLRKQYATKTGADTSRIEQEKLDAQKDALDKTEEAYKNHIDKLVNEEKRLLEEAKRLHEERVAFAQRIKDKLADLQETGKSPQEILNQRERRFQEEKAKFDKAFKAGMYEEARKHAERMLTLSDKISEQEKTLGKDEKSIATRESNRVKTIGDLADKAFDKQEKATLKAAKVVKNQVVILQNALIGLQKESEKLAQLLSVQHKIIIDADTTKIKQAADEIDRLTAKKERTVYIRAEMREAEKFLATLPDLVLKGRIEDILLGLKGLATGLSSFQKDFEQWDVELVAKMGLNESVSSMNSLLKLINETKESFAVPLVFNAEEAISGIDKLISKLNELIKARAKASGDTLNQPTEDNTPGFAKGGKIPGYGGGDAVAAYLEKGEFVVRKEAVAHYGQNTLKAINNIQWKQAIPRFATGGIVSSVPAQQEVSRSVQLNITFNSSPVGTVYGDNNSINGLVALLRKHELGLA